MIRCLRSLILLALAPATAAAQAWSDGATLALVRRAVEAHTSEPAGQPFRARARGLVTFHVEIATDGAPAARLLRADEIDVEIRKSGTGSTRQVIRAWRDSTFFPTATNYHRDHLGVVTDDFGPRIRLGDGDEVAEVPHPLSEAGALVYEFRLRDTVRLATPAGDLAVVTVEVRPREGSIPAVVGTLDLEIRTAALVRSRFSFTGAAYRDRDLEDISVRLERAFIDGRTWLPYRQEIEIRRRSGVADLPLRGVIRGRWEISEHDLEPAFEPGDFLGPPIGGLRRPGGPPIWANSLLVALDSLPRVAGDADLDRVRREAIGVARAKWLEGLPAVRPAVSRVSDVLRVNRVQGLVLGAGLSWRFGSGLGASALAAFGTADGRTTGTVELVAGSGRDRWSASASRAVTDAVDPRVASGVVGSLAAQEGGRDYGDYALVERLAIGWERVGEGSEMEITLAREWAWSVETAARPARGSYRTNPPLGSRPYWVVTGRLVARGTGLSGSRGELRLLAEAGAGAGTGDVPGPRSYARLLADGSISRHFAGGEASGRLLVGSGSTGLPTRRSFAIGGRATLPGVPFRAWGGRHLALARVEWLGRVPGLALPLGSYGRTAAEAWAGPFVALGWAGGDLPDAPWRASAGVRSSVGIAVELLSRAVRLEVGRSLRGGASLGVTFDFSRDWWPIL